MKRQNPTLILIVITCFGLLPKAQAVNPPPDGDYAGGNTAEGQNALLSLTTGTYNTAVGLFSLLSNTESNFNTGIGAGTLLANTADENTATGAGALLSNTTGSPNTANGAFALFNNTTASGNTANGFEALFLNTTGENNTATGRSALGGNETGDNNTAIGSMALNGNSTGSSNTAVGEDALRSPVGNIGSGNTAVGNRALFAPFGGPGDNNTAIGAGAGSTLGEFDSNNIDIGFNVGISGDSNTIWIGNDDITDTFIKGISGQTVVSGAAVLVGANGHLGTMTSSKRFKEKIKPMDKASEALFSLRPVTFRYKKEIDPEGTQQFGLVAEDVEKINPNLVVRDENGKLNSVRYDQVNAMLLNEFLKEHCTVLELKKEIAALTATVKEQALQIQKVSSQLDVQKPALQTVVDNH